MKHITLSLLVCASTVYAADHEGELHLNAHEVALLQAIRNDDFSQACESIMQAHALEEKGGFVPAIPNEKVAGSVDCLIATAVTQVESTTPHPSGSIYATYKQISKPDMGIQKFLEQQVKSLNGKSTVDVLAYTRHFTNALNMSPNVQQAYAHLKDKNASLASCAAYVIAFSVVMAHQEAWNFPGINLGIKCISMAELMKENQQLTFDETTQNKWSGAVGTIPALWQAIYNVNSNPPSREKIIQEIQKQTAKDNN